MNAGLLEGKDTRMRKKRSAEGSTWQAGVLAGWFTDISRQKMQWLLAALHSPRNLVGHCLASVAGWQNSYRHPIGCFCWMQLYIKKHQTNQTPIQQPALLIPKTSVLKKEKFLFFFIQLDSFFTPTIGLMSDRDISNYTLNQIISTHKKCALGI